MWLELHLSSINRVYSQPPCLQAESLIIAPSLLQQPPTILQHLPATMMPSGSAPSIRPGGHVKEATADCLELIMIQNAQMHQVIMNNMAILALSSFGCSSSLSGPGVGIRQGSGSVHSIKCQILLKWILTFGMEKNSH
ncbi:uncharacterized protein C21orf58-like [Anarrhichthys ocellatus]|uniref:uncharacterized protein C21orf58-like n=1 Tax=Anarrhichthys ocellatus TaxID=433405 RepID=UPI0012EDF0E3|nr:uncharacterized protein C21orf58-like [Anarrhichthys ocellatus]